MDTAVGILEVERESESLILTPHRNLGELDFQDIQAEMKEIVHAWEEDHSLRNVVVDFANTDLFGSTALGMFLRLRRLVGVRDGRMVFCNVSAHEREILTVTALGEFWRVYPSRNAALKAVVG